MEAARASAPQNRAHEPGVAAITPRISTLRMPWTSGRATVQPPGVVMPPG
jgi:hypothetical protein